LHTFAAFKDKSDKHMLSLIYHGGLNNSNEGELNNNHFLTDTIMTIV